jgi:hypothetical protein
MLALFALIAVVSATEYVITGEGYATAVIELKKCMNMEN